MFKYTIVPFLTLLALSSCKKDDKGESVSAIPKITLSNLDNNIFNFKDTTSIININFRLVDDDKDLGRKIDENAITIEDWRSGELYRVLKYPLPQIPLDILLKDYFDAFVTVPLKSVIFTPRPDSLHLKTLRDTLQLKIFVTDESGNISNIETTKNIFIEP